MRVPPLWTAEQASHFTDFLGHVLEAIWDEHSDAIVDLIVNHGGTRGGCLCRDCRPYDPAPEEPSHDPADIDDDIPF